MKKIIIVSLLVTLVSVITASAQENTYSIVVKMQNGTVLTIGPNEADSIYFTEGKLNVSGQSIEDIIKHVDIIDKHSKETDEAIALLHSLFDALVAETRKLENSVNDIKGDVLGNELNLFTLQGQTATLSEVISVHEKKLKEMDAIKELVQNIKASDNAQEATIIELQMRIVELQMKNADAEARIAQLEKVVEELRNK